MFLICFKYVFFLEYCLKHIWSIKNIFKKKYVLLKKTLVFINPVFNVRLQDFNVRLLDESTYAVLNVSLSIA